MKIGINTLFLIPREVGGSETILCEVLNALVEHWPYIDLHLFTNRENDSSFRSRFREVKRVTFTKLDFPAKNRFLRIFREQTELSLRVKQAAVDVLWSPGYTAPFYSPCPQAVSILDVQYKQHPEDLNFATRWATHWFVKMAGKRADLILTLSEFSKREIIKFYGVPEERIFVSHCGVHPDFAHPYSMGDRQKFLSTIMPDQDPYVLCVANSYPHKNLHLLINAFGKLVREIPHRLVLIGQPRRGEVLVKKAMAQLPKGRVIRLNHFYKPELVWFFQGADLFVFPSLYEGFGLPPLEAMMAGVPVVTTRMASIPEICGDCVFYFDASSSDDLANKIRHTLSLDSDTKHQLVERARKRASAFSWQTTAEKIIRCFRMMIDERRL